MFECIKWLLCGTLGTHYGVLNHSNRLDDVSLNTDTQKYTKSLNWENPKFPKILFPTSVTCHHHNHLSKNDIKELTVTLHRSITIIAGQSLSLSTLTAKLVPCSSSYSIYT